MKRLFSYALLILAPLTHYGQADVLNYDFTLKISGLPDSIDSAAYIANYYGNKQYYYDTITIEEGGIIRMKGDSIKAGIYSMIAQDRKSYFEFVVNEPKIELETNFKDYVSNMKVKTSDENKYFYEYLRFVNGKSMTVNNLNAKLPALQGKEREKVEAQLKAIDEEVIAYKEQFMVDHPDLFISKVFSTSADPEVPDYSEIKDDAERNKRRYLDFKRVYLDNVDLTDERLLRTPILHKKITYYITKLTPQAPDSIIAAADHLVKLTGETKETRKYAVHTITSKYEDSKIMGMDAVLVHMGENYYCPNQAWWLSEDKLENFCERINAMSPLLIGKTAPNLILLDTNGVWQNLHEIDAKYTVLYFWDSGCGHCKKVTPKLLDFYKEYKSKGIEVYAVGTEFEVEDWKKYIIKNGLTWVNVSDTPEANENAYDLISQGKTTLESLNFRDTYDIFSTPKIFLLDQDKKIIATKLSPEQIGGFIDDQLNEGATKKDSGKSSKKAQ